MNVSGNLQPTWQLLLININSAYYEYILVGYVNSTFKHVCIKDDLLFLPYPNAEYKKQNKAHIESAYLGDQGLQKPLHCQSTNL